MALDVCGISPLFLSEATPKETIYVQPSTLQQSPSVKVTEKKYQWEIVWRNVITFVYLHVAALYGMYLYFFVCNWGTFFYMLLFSLFLSLGITAGAHRLWSHRAYKAQLPLRIFLMIFQTISIQNDIFEWARDHRVHHKFGDTDADPHNPTRGFFFAHIGWLLVKKHEDVKIKGKTVDMSDLEADAVVQFQKKYYLWLVLLFGIIIPILIPIYFFGEDPWTSFYVAGVFRYTASLNFSWLVNSVTHTWGNKPYDKTIGPTQNVYVSILAFGEGWHNYHHVFPWDYKAAELGGYKLNYTTMMLDFFAKIGWAYDLKTVPLGMIEKRVKRTGDGTRKIGTEDDNKHHHGGGVWGWGDADMNEDDIRSVKAYKCL